MDIRPLRGRLRSWMSPHICAHGCRYMSALMDVATYLHSWLSPHIRAHDCRCTFFAALFLEEIPFIHLYPIGAAYLAHLVGIGFSGVVFLLVFYVAGHRRHARGGHGDGAVALAPATEMRKPLTVVLHPNARARLEVTHEIGHGHRGTYLHKQVGVVGHPSNPAHLRATALDKPTEVAVEVVGVVSGYDPLAGERPEHDVVNQAAVAHTGAKLWR